jgi:ligand-binding SRPBCC domain-containing protein
LYLINLQIMRTLEFTQFLPMSVENAWKFFSNPANLSKITPREMNFIIMSQIPEQIYPGMIITYKVSPVFSIPVKWVTEITQVKEPFYFVDDQRSGPYAIWHHEHHFEVVENGVMMTDKLFYKIPFGFIGNLLDRMFIHKKVCGIFEFRKAILEEKYA